MEVDNIFVRDAEDLSARSFVTLFPCERNKRSLITILIQQRHDSIHKELLCSASP